MSADTDAPSSRRSSRLRPHRPVLLPQRRHQLVALPVRHLFGQLLALRYAVELEDGRSDLRGDQKRGLELERGARDEDESFLPLLLVARVLVAFFLALACSFCCCFGGDGGYRLRREASLFRQGLDRVAPFDDHLDDDGSRAALALCSLAAGDGGAELALLLPREGGRRG